jgi:signal peptidase I
MTLKTGNMTSARWKPSSGGLVLALLVCGMLLGLGILRHRFRLGIVIGRSMLPTLAGGDLLIIDEQAYRGTRPQRGDIVVAHYVKNFVIKRIVAFGGETVEVRNGALYVNGSVLRENYSTIQGPCNIDKGRLFAGKLATLGDNRGIPACLAVYPIITQDRILGKVIYSAHWKNPFRKANSPSTTTLPR